jgi:hypothetical protein
VASPPCPMRFSGKHRDQRGLHINMCHNKLAPALAVDRVCWGLPNMASNKLGGGQSKWQTSTHASTAPLPPFAKTLNP